MPFVFLKSIEPGLKLKLLLFMRWKTLTVLLTLFVVLSGFFLDALAAAPPVTVSPKMRPYAGIGVLRLAIPTDSGRDQIEPVYLYVEPALTRLMELDSAKTPSHEWIFGKPDDKSLLIVMARRGEWLQVAFDDSGREAWLNPRAGDLFQLWPDFLKGKSCGLLSALNKKFYQLFQFPGKQPLSALVPKQIFKVIKLEGDWALVMPEPNSLGWLRWQDDDGRLLIGLEKAFPVSR